MSFYTDIKSELAAMFADEPFLPGTIVRETKGVYDPATRRTSAGSTVSIPCRAFPDTATVTALDGTRSSYTTVMCNTPMMINDKITIVGVEYIATKTSGNALTGLYEADVTA